MAFGPDVRIPENIAAMELWVEVSATDQEGIVVDGMKKGDILEIHDISGICSFSESDNKVLAGFVAIAGGILQDGTNYYTKDKADKTNEALEQQTKELQAELSNKNPNKRRDGYGQDPGTDDFAKHEGGIIVCMPEAKGPLYATEENWLAGGAKKNGRLPEFISENIKSKNSFFPCRKTGGALSAKAMVDGTFHILAFDQKFNDNGGTYTVKVIVTRENQFMPHEEAKRKLLEQKII